MDGTGGQYFWLLHSETVFGVRIGLRGCGVIATRRTWASVSSDRTVAKRMKCILWLDVPGSGVLVPQFFPIWPAAATTTILFMSACIHLVYCSSLLPYEYRLLLHHFSLVLHLQLTFD